MGTIKFNNALKDIMSKNGISVLAYNLTTHKIDIEVASNEHKSVLKALQNGIDSFINNGMVANESIETFKEFIQKIDAGDSCDKCEVCIINGTKKCRIWSEFSYFMEKDGGNCVAIITIKNIEDEVRKKLLTSFWNKQITSGVRDGNSYFIVNLDDGIIYNSHGKLAIETQDFAEQINYIASMCGDVSQKVRALFSKESLLNLCDKNCMVEVMDVLINDIGDEPKWFKINAMLAEHPVTKKNFIQLVFIDIDARFRETEDIKYSATHDELTDVLNKRSFMEMATARLDKLNNNYWKALIFIDIDDFKKVNDANGHIIGDRVLRGIASGIKKSFRSSDVIGRVGGDEFMVLFSAPSLYALYSRLNLINANISQTAQVENVTVSFGVVVFFEKDNDFSQLYYLSDKAMYNAKKTGKKCYCIMDQYTNCFLNDVMLHMENDKVEHIMKLKITDYIFGNLSEGSVNIDYITPKLFNKVFSGKNITKIENLREFLSKEDYDHLVNFIQSVFKADDVQETNIKIKDCEFKAYASNSGDEFIIGLQKTENN